MDDSGKGLEVRQSDATRRATLYVVATPIGNLGDISLRARATLESVDRVAAEDTRNTARLLEQLGLRKPLMAHHAHNEQASAQGILQCLERGESIALVSDAGTPAVSDPGAVVVRVVAQAGYPVVPVPGASSVLTALAASGLVDGAFTFRGFLPAKGKERLNLLAHWVSLPEPQILFEAPHRVLQLVDELAQQGLNDRAVCAGREMTKQFETFYRGLGADVFEQVRSDPNAERGEWVWVISGAPPEPETADGVNVGLDDWLKPLLAELPLKSAVAVAVKATGLPKNAVYERALQLKGP
ncbi:16S rRNA (cytidine(1402)-2'-O)-methyltransferase [Limnobacter humi]|uniref:Ribosomal RNA small subunit methyltransferase I n=1 Tax=Limnobacter humi TaxID=1778671 RepID=A0ABT1WE25_9BURK|nr:16S rRNA (cytidine(1402)-2'-O)-methyltransferase [Limnobacter humi]MCQ8895773.1 16S rRNA (cytidine(1402)-2'-O)-methyltransferase [Limnobacter humi]